MGESPSSAAADHESQEIDRQEARAQRRNERYARDLTGLLSQRWPRVALAVATYQAARPAYHWARGKWYDWTTYTIRVSGAESLYDDVHAWVIQQLPPGKQRSLIATTRYEQARGERQETLALQHDSKTAQEIRIGGHKIEVSTASAGRHQHQSSEGGAWTPPEITLTAYSQAARDALVEELARLVHRGNRTVNPSIRIYGEWGWQRLDDLPLRTLESVILPSGQLDRIVADAQQFLASEAQYIHRSIPWHRGYLFHGPPGTGKTSAAKAIAAHLGMDLWYLPLADVRKDGDLLRKVAEVERGSVLLLEDLDVFHAARIRDDSSAVTLAGLLNSLDGVTTPHGLIIIMTTNDLSAIDDAVIRPGRADVIEHFGLCTSEQAYRIISYFFETWLPDEGDLTGLAPAAVMEACKRCDDPQEALAELRKESVSGW